jgi:glycosyltransferase involved in cell wall biosynthesis
MAQTFFSIIVPCHNQFEFIGDAIQSVLAQTYANREVIVVDDASTDSSLELIGAFGDEIEVVHLEKNVGRSGARNAGAAVARGEYLVFLDGDDALKPWALTIYERLIRRYKPTLILGRLTWFQGQVPAVDAEKVPPEIKVVNYENFAEKDRPFRSAASAITVAPRFRARGRLVRESRAV